MKEKSENSVTLPYRELRDLIAQAYMDGYAVGCYDKPLWYLIIAVCAGMTAGIVLGAAIH